VHPESGIYALTVKDSASSGITVWFVGGPDGTPPESSAPASRGVRYDHD
jgi:hypothetical protein